MNFDALAPHYRWLEAVLANGKLHRCRTAFLAEIDRPERILLVGEGHGRCVVECVRRFPGARITCVDSSAGMIAAAQSRLTRHGGETGRVSWIHASALEWTPPAAAFDLVVTQFFLDCFRAEQVAAVISRLATAAAPGADWLVADFQVAPAGWKRARSRLILRLMYAFFRALTQLAADRLTPPDLHLRRSGFALRRRIETEWGLLHSDWWVRSE